MPGFGLSVQRHHLGYVRGATYASRRELREKGSRIADPHRLAANSEVTALEFSCGSESYELMARRYGFN